MAIYFLFGIVYVESLFLNEIISRPIFDDMLIYNSHSCDFSHNTRAYIILTSIFTSGLSIQHI